MKRMKTFFTYALLIAAFWIFSNMIIFLSINGIYKPKATKIYISSPQVTIEASNGTYVNGYVKGSIKNNTEEILKDVYLKIDLYSPRDMNLGPKYVKIDNLAKNETQDFEMWYEFTDVDCVKISTTTDVQNVDDEAFISKEIRMYWLYAKLIYLFFFV